MGLSQSERARRARACTLVRVRYTPGGRNPTDTSQPLLLVIHIRLVDNNVM